MKEYWTDVTDEWLLRYMEEKDQSKADEIYEQYLHQPFEKLVECILNRLNNHEYVEVGVENLKRDTLSHLVSKIPFYKPERTKKGKRSFGFFNVVAKRFIQQANMKGYRRYLSQGVSLDRIDESERDKIIGIHSHKRVRETTIKSEFAREALNFWKNNAARYYEQKYRDIIVPILQTCLVEIGPRHQKKIDVVTMIKDRFNLAEATTRVRLKELSRMNAVLYKHWRWYGSLETEKDLLYRRLGHCFNSGSMYGRDDALF